MHVNDKKTLKSKFPLLFEENEAKKEWQRH